MTTYRSIVLTVTATAGALLAAGPALAHSMSADVEVRAGTVRVLVYFEDDLPAELATVSVTDAAGAEVAAGTTDERGVWAFAAPAAGEYRLTARCAGHVATQTFSVAAPAAPAADAEPIGYTAPRVNRARGLAIGAGGLLGLSALFWVFRRRP